MSLRRLAVLLLAVAVLVTGAPSMAAAAPLPSQQDEVTSTTASEGDSSVGDILPRPNSGQAPDSPNDPGGWQQYLVFAALFVGLAAIALLVRRESRRARAARGDRIA